MLYYVPLESLPERYTAQMFDTVIDTLTRRGVNHQIITGVPLRGVTKSHQFLPPASRVHMCASQVQKIARLFDTGEIQNGDVFFIADMWHFGVESIKYMAQLNDIDVKVYTINYAGVFSPHDLLTHKLTGWSRSLEEAWHIFYDGIFYGSEWHRKTVIKAMAEWDDYPRWFETKLQQKSHVTGLVWDEQAAVALADEKSNYTDDRKMVMWPHRDAPSRNITEFYQLVEVMKDDYPDVRWVITSSRMGETMKLEYDHLPIEYITMSKPQYYATLREADLMLTTALQETFGYTIHEATAFGAPILAPDRTSYPETILSSENIYTGFGDLVNKVKMALDGTLPVATIKKRGYFDDMLSIMVE